MLLRRRHLYVSLATLLAATLLLAGTAQAAIHSVTVAPGFVFVPADITVNEGDTVEWTWTGSHSVTSGTGPTDLNTGVEFDSGVLLNPAGPFSQTFNSTGDFDYYCAPHFAFGMTGVVHVVSAAPVPSMGAWALLATAMLMCSAGVWMSLSRRSVQRVASKD